MLATELPCDPGILLHKRLKNAQAAYHRDACYPHLPQHKSLSPRPEITLDIYPQTMNQKEHDVHTVGHMSFGKGTQTGEHHVN